MHPPLARSVAHNKASISHSIKSGIINCDLQLTPHH